MTLNARMRSALLALAGAAPAALTGIALTAARPEVTPARASAGEAGAAQGVEVRPAELTAAQRASLAHAAEVRAAGMGRSPLYYPPARETGRGAREEERSAVELAAPDLMVTSVVRGERAVFAIVNGRARRVGDEVEPGWTLVEIDPQRARVTVRCEDGRELVGVVGRNWR